ncbi:hypothetical protein BK127_36865 [Paenibacillus sp. FSL H7-0331]|nr:hypothetical protein BK127_36865 [Paenibacillus sp. FSL H7-0331]
MCNHVKLPRKGNDAQRGEQKEKKRWYSEKTCFVGELASVQQSNLMQGCQLTRQPFGMRVNQQLIIFNMKKGVI